MNLKIAFVLRDISHHVGNEMKQAPLYNALFISVIVIILLAAKYVVMDTEAYDLDHVSPTLQSLMD